MAAETMFGQLQVMVVEDSWHIASAIKSMIENVGMQVVGPAATLTEALQVLAASHPDMAVVDVNLQGDLAYGLIDQLLDRAIPVVIVSGYEISPALANRADTVLKKPIRASVLLTTLRAIAAKRLVS